MFLHLKNANVSFQGLSIHTIKALYHAMEVYRLHGVNNLTVTSAHDGEHMRGSLHYLGYAIDIRIWSIPDILGVRDEIQFALGDDYDVILEKDHIHIEYDPKF